MQADEVDINVSLVGRLVAAQFPQWADLLGEPIEVDGWDNATFRLGPRMTVRLPNAARYAPQVEKVHQWLPKLAPLLPLPIPVPLTKGLRAWAILRVTWRSRGPSLEAKAGTPSARSFSRTKRRGRGWVLWKGLITLAEHIDTNPLEAGRARRIINVVLAEHDA